MQTLEVFAEGFWAFQAFQAFHEEHDEWNLPIRAQEMDQSG
jgi:hypothetical protein